MHGFLIKLITQTLQGSILHRHVQIWRTCCCRRMRKNAFVRLPINVDVRLFKRVTVRCLTQLLKYYFKITKCLHEKWWHFKMHCSLSICSGKHICFVQNKSLSSDMQVSRTQREALRPLAGSITGLWQMLILFYCLSWMRMYRPSNDFMQEEAEGQAVTRSSHARSLD